MKKEHNAAFRRWADGRHIERRIAADVMFGTMQIAVQITRAAKTEANCLITLKRLRACACRSNASARLPVSIFGRAT